MSEQARMKMSDTGNSILDVTALRICKKTRSLVEQRSLVLPSTTFGRPVYLP